MAITNAIQGLNQTVELLSRILANIETSNQQLGKEATEVKTSDGKKATSLDGLGSTVKMFEKINPKKAKDGAQSAADILKIISSKDFTGNITKLALIAPFMFMVSKTIKQLVNIINLIDKVNIDKEKLKTFESGIQTISNVAKILPKLILSLGMIVVAAVAIGTLAIYAWEPMLYGFSAIASIALLTIGTFALIAKITKDRKNFDKIIINMLALIVGISMIPIISAAVGVLAIHASKYIWAGFGTIIAIALSIAAIIMIIKMVAHLIDVISKIKKIGKLKSFATFFKGSMNTETGIPAVDNITALLLGISGIIILSVIVGFMATKVSNELWTGFGIIAGIMLALGAIIAVMSRIIKPESANILKAVSGLILSIAATIAILTIVAFAMTELNKRIEETGIWKAVGLVSGLLAAMVAILALVGAIVSSGIGAAVIFAGVALILAATFAIGTIVHLAFKMVELNTLLKDQTFDNASIDKYTYLGKAIGVLCTSISSALSIKTIGKIMLAVIPLNMMLNAIGKFVDIIGKIAADDSGNMSIISVNEKGEAVKGGKVNVIKIANALSNSFSTFMTKISETFANFEYKDRRRFVNGAKAAERVMNTCGKLVDLIENANKRISSAKLESVASSISNAFSTFMTSLSKSFNEMETRSAIIITFLSDNVAEIMSGIDGFTNGILALSKLNTNSINTTADNIAKGMNKLFETLSTENIPNQFKSNNIATIIKNINQEFVAALSEMTKPISQNVTTQFDNFITKLTDANFETAKSNIDNIKVSLQNYNDIADKSVDIINKQITKFDDFTESVKDLVDALNDLEKTNANLNLNLNSNTNSTTENNKPTKAKEQEKPIEVIVKNVGESLNITDFADAIKDAFNGNTIKITFNDSRDDIIGQVSML